MIKKGFDKKGNKFYYNALTGKVKSDKPGCDYSAPKK